MQHKDAAGNLYCPQGNKIDQLLSATSKLEEALKHLQEAQKDSHQELKELSQELVKRSEEVKDAYYLAQINKERLEEHSGQSDRRLDKQDEVIEEIKRLVEKVKKTVDVLEERRDKKILLIVQAVITIFSIAFGILVKLNVI